MVHVQLGSVQLARGCRRTRERVMDQQRADTQVFDQLSVGDLVSLAALAALAACAWGSSGALRARQVRWAAALAVLALLLLVLATFTGMIGHYGPAPRY